MDLLICFTLAHAPSTPKAPWFELARLAAEADHSANLAIVNKNGEIFQEVSTDLPSGFEQLLLAAHLIPKVELVAQIWSRADLLGWVHKVPPGINRDQVKPGPAHAGAITARIP